MKTQVNENKNTFSGVISTHCEVVQPPSLAEGLLYFAILLPSTSCKLLVIIKESKETS